MKNFIFIVVVISLAVNVFTDLVDEFSPFQGTHYWVDSFYTASGCGEFLFSPEVCEDKVFFWKDGQKCHFFIGNLKKDPRSTGWWLGNVLKDYNSLWGAVEHCALTSQYPSVTWEIINQMINWKLVSPNEFKTLSKDRIESILCSYTEIWYSFISCVTEYAKSEMSCFIKQTFMELQEAPDYGVAWSKVIAWGDDWIMFSNSDFLLQIAIEGKWEQEVSEGFYFQQEPEYFIIGVGNDLHQDIDQERFFDDKYLFEYLSYKLKYYFGLEFEEPRPEEYFSFYDI